jgi:hypothetical protein
LRGLGFFIRCCGGLFATTFTARSKRAHASGSNSNGFSFLGTIMPAQPLSNVRSDAKIQMGPVNLDARPEAAIWIAKCIAMWSEVELQLGMMMTSFLGEVAAPTVAIYIDLLAFRTRIQALTAAAQQTLALEQHEIFEALISLARAATKKRDRFAHWLWAFSDTLPNAVLLVDPRDHLPKMTGLITKAIKQEELFLDDFVVSKDKIWVYTPKEFEEIFDEFRDLHRHLSIFNRMVLMGGDVLKQYQLFYALSQEPQIAQFVSRQREVRNKSQSKPEQPQT